jgi:hypothetical protein
MSLPRLRRTHWVVNGSSADRRSPLVKITRSPRRSYGSGDRRFWLAGQLAGDPHFPPPALFNVLQKVGKVQTVRHVLFSMGHYALALWPITARPIARHTTGQARGRAIPMTASGRTKLVRRRRRCLRQNRGKPQSKIPRPRRRPSGGRHVMRFCPRRPETSPTPPRPAAHRRSALLSHPRIWRASAPGSDTA